MSSPRLSPSRRRACHSSAAHHDRHWTGSRSSGTDKGPGSVRASLLPSCVPASDSCELRSSRPCSVRSRRSRSDAAGALDRSWPTRKISEREQGPPYGGTSARQPTVMREFTTPSDDTPLTGGYSSWPSSKPWPRLDTCSHHRRGTAMPLSSQPHSPRHHPGASCACGTRATRRAHRIKANFDSAAARQADINPPAPNLRP
jgi:hypothetical protein